jgi:pimeloyl-ACP methyl ester carboxylesterase
VWGSADTRTAVCVHGLTGCSRDFDSLAPALAATGYRVVCPDVVGRGNSDYLADPKGYELRQYAADMRTLVTDLDLQAVDWIGTSMGGLIGMALAARDGTPIRRLILNDIGPFIPTAALQRLGRYVGADPSFPDLAAAEAYLRETRAPFGNLTDNQWRSMAERSTRADSSGGVRLHFDKGIAVRFNETSDQDADLWKLWDAIDCPVLVLRGEDSDLLLRETANEMATRGPGAEVIEFPGCGHNPPLLERPEIDAIIDWLGARA